MQEPACRRLFRSSTKERIACKQASYKDLYTWTRQSCRVFAKQEDGRGLALSEQKLPQLHSCENGRQATQHASERIQRRQSPAA